MTVTRGSRAACDVDHKTTFLEEVSVALAPVPQTLEENDPNVLQNAHV
jgi:hypothetical protein